MNDKVVVLADVHAEHESCDDDDAHVLPQLAMKQAKELEQLQKSQREQLEKLEKFNEQVKAQSRGSSEELDFI